MKVIPINVTAAIEIGGHRQELSYPQLIRNCLDTPPEGGFKFSDMRDRLKIADKLDEAAKKDAKSIKLEDAEYATLKVAVEKMRWAVLSKDILAFSEAVISATD